MMRALAGLVPALALSFAASADPGGRLLATGGAGSVDGAAGGGITTWAVLAGYGTGEEDGATAFATRAVTDDYALEVAGASLALRNRLELSVARQRFDLGPVATALSLPSPWLEQDVFGAKLRLHGDLVYGAGPQIALGVQHRRHRDFGVPAALGARADSDTEFYLAASKLHLAAAGGYHLLWNAALRRSRANQLGLLGYGGDAGGREWLFEGSLAVLLSPSLAVGVEYRQKPDLLSAVDEDDWRTAFVAWFPNKRVAVVGALADLGNVGPLPGQDGAYLSLQLSF